MRSSNYRKQDKAAFTRKKFIHRVPDNKVLKYNMGTYKPDYTHVVEIKSDRQIQIADVALEAARKVAGKVLEEAEKAGKVKGYLIEVKAHPHHILREHRVIFGAGADRLSQGMTLAFGSSRGSAARVSEGQVILSVSTYEQHTEFVKSVLKSVVKKLPCTYSIAVSPKR